MPKLKTKNVVIQKKEIKQLGVWHASRTYPACSHCHENLTRKWDKKSGAYWYCAKCKTYTKSCFELP